jgi:iron complex transport system substrate-binding protein
MIRNSISAIPAAPFRLARPAAAALALGLAVLPQVAMAGASRIVAAGGVVSEIVHALGRTELLAGVDTTSLYPADLLKSKPNVGYVRALSAEGVLSLKPDLLLAVEAAGPPDALKLIAAAGIRIATIPEDLTETGVARRIRAVGAAIEEGPAAETLARDVETRFAALQSARTALGPKKRVLFVLSLQNGRVMVGGRDTSADAIITLAGGINAAGNVAGFKPLSDEGLIVAAPDVIVMMKRGPDSAKPDEVFTLPAFSAVPAAKTRALVVMDGLYLLGFGPRTPDAARDLMTAIYNPGGAAGPKP